MTKSRYGTIKMVGSLGTGAHIFGSIILFFTAIFLFIEMYLTAFIILVIALFLIGYRNTTLIDSDKLIIRYKWGFFVAFVLKKTISIVGAKAIVVTRHVSKIRPNMRSGPTDYHIEIELPLSKVRVWEYYEHEKAHEKAREIAELLNIRYYQGSELKY